MSSPTMPSSPTPRRAAGSPKDRPRPVLTTSVTTTALLVVLAILVAGCGSGTTSEGPDAPRTSMLVVSVSGLRADADPEGVVFQTGAGVWAPSPLDVQSAASLLTGRYPTRAGAIGLAEAQPPPDAPTLATLLRRAGYGTAWISQESWGSRDGFTRGHDWVETPPDGGWPDAEVVRRAEAAVRGLAAQESPFLVAVQFSAPVTPTESELEAGELRQDHAAAAATRLASVGGLLLLFYSALADRGGLDAIVVAVLGTAGFELGERGGVGNGWAAEPAASLVPFSLRVPGLGEPCRERPISPVDLAPTLLTIAGAQTPAPPDGDAFDGLSLVTLGADGLSFADLPGDRVVQSELVVRERAIERSLVGADGYRYLHAVRRIPPADRAVVARGYEELQAAMVSGATPTPPVFGEAAVEQLFAPGATEPLDLDSLDDEAGRALRELRSALRAYRAACDASAYEPLSITRRLDLDPEQMRELESLGYL